MLTIIMTIEVSDWWWWQPSASQSVATAWAEDNGSSNPLLTSTHSAHSHQIAAKWSHINTLLSANVEVEINFMCIILVAHNEINLHEVNQERHRIEIYLLSRINTEFEKFYKRFKGFSKTQYIQIIIITRAVERWRWPIHSKMLLSGG